MYAQQLGFSSSWKMLTRDAGWPKPLCLLALLGWIPILGQIVVFGYALEWARLTAWGIDATPKQHGVDYGKVLSSGGRAFLVYLTMSIAVNVVLGILGGGRFVDLMDLLTFNMTFVGWAFAGGTGVLSQGGIIGFVLSLLVGTFIMAAMLRATLYDAFGAGWRLDRVCQMIGRDAGGFLRTCLVTLIGSLILVGCALLAGMIAGVAVVGGLFSVMGSGFMYLDHGGWGYLVQRMLGLGVGPVLLLVVLFIVAAFAYGFLSVAMQLVTVNAVGQWFCRFEVGRWGVSSDPLPDGVPVKNEGSVRWDRTNGSPARPVSGAAPSNVPPSSAAASNASSNDSYWDEPVTASSRKTPVAEQPAAQPAAQPDEPASREPILLGPVTLAEDEGPIASDDTSGEDAPIA